LDSSSHASGYILFKASSQAIIFSFHTSLELPSSALNSLYLENHITINDANIHNTKSRAIDVT
jgi:hypothetical protein